MIVMNKLIINKVIFIKLFISFFILPFFLICVKYQKQTTLFKKGVVGFM